MTDVEEKNWGTVWHIFVSPDAAVSYLELKAGERCSRHYHADRANLFAVVSGRICVEVWYNVPTYPADGMKVVSPGETFEVSTNAWHRFSVIESGRIIEVYRPMGGYVRKNDIQRFDVGGPFDLDELKKELADRRVR